MKGQLIPFFTEINPMMIIAAVMPLVFLCRLCFRQRENIFALFDNLYRRKKQKEELLQTIKDNQTNIKEIMDNRMHDRRQSLAIQKELTDAQKRLSDSLSDISRKIDALQQSTDERFIESERKNNKRIRAELKDKISQSYRYYHSLGKINDMELEALEDLMEEYESADGKNSFVHSVVQREMYTWEKI